MITKAHFSSLFIIGYKHPIFVVSIGKKQGKGRCSAPDVFHTPFCKQLIITKKSIFVA
jgi:hypothetical protein